MKLASLLLVASLPLMACASSDDVTPEGEPGDDVSGASDADITSGAAAKLIKKTYKTTVTATGGVKCTYDISWLTVTNLSTSVRTAVNTALYFGPKTPDFTCEAPGLEVEGGYSKYSVNSFGVLSLMYGNFQMGTGAAHPNTIVKPVNLNLTTGKAILLADLLNAEGKKTMLESCKTQWKAHTTAQGEPDFGGPEACDGALSVDEYQTTEQFTIEKTGLRVHLDNQLPHVIVALAGDGFLVTWAQLGNGLKANSAVKGFAKR